MASGLRLTLGAPGVYRVSEPPPWAPPGVRMDVCAFAGVAPRGPAREAYVGGRWRDDVPTVEPERPVRRSVAVPVESWTDYLRLYGGFEVPAALLPGAVAAFFDNGGRRAYIVRIVHDYGDRAVDMDARAHGRLRGLVGPAGDVTLVARNEGSWGDGLRATLSYAIRPLPLAGAGPVARVRPTDDVVPGALVRVTAGGVRSLHRVDDIVDLPDRREGRRLELTPPVVVGPGTLLEVVEADLRLDDGDGRTERHAALGLAPVHPRFIATVLCRDSQLALPHHDWADAALHPAGPELDPVRSGPFTGGVDRWQDIVPDDFFHTGAALVDVPRDGMECLAEAPEVALVVAPDLYAPVAAPPAGPVADPAPDGAVFADCVPRGQAARPTRATVPLRGLARDPRSAAHLAEITSLQRRLVEEVAEPMGAVALLDVPPGLPDEAILRWRRSLRSGFAAAYHPWLLAAGGGPRPIPRRVTPSAVAAGVIARREAEHGITWGPANELAVGIADVTDRVSFARHDALHQEGVNVLLRERDGVRLTAARTLSTDAAYRQLSVRRLVTMIVRTLDDECEWTVFEPNTPALRADVRTFLERFMRDLYRRGAFRGATPAAAYQVRCDDELNPRQVQEAGRLVAEIRIDPAEPVEFLVLRIVRDGDGTLRLDGRDG